MTVLNEHSLLKLSVLSFNSHTCQTLSVWALDHFELYFFVKSIIDLTTSNEKYGQGHLPIFDPGLLYQASHKNTIELCKINIFYLHKIFSLQEICLTKSDKNSPGLEKYPEITYSVHDLIIKIANWFNLVRLFSAKFYMCLELQNIQNQALAAF